MELFSREKKSSTAPTSAANTNSAPQTTALDPRVLREFSKHPTGFYKNAQKDRRGVPIASKVYWNTNPPTACPDVQQHSAFDTDFVDVERYDTRDSRPPSHQEPTHYFNRVYRSGNTTPDAVRPVGPSPEYAIIRSWIGKCNKEHKQCVVERAIAKLKAITLIDVRNQRLIHYKPGLQYVALSYVWGRGVVIPKRKPGRPSDLPDNISRTVIHAMFVADKIGIPFLWADAVCINQHDAKEKKQQFPLMDYIYEQAFATIVSLGDNATVGLPGVDNGPSRYPQVAAEFGSLKLLSRCPKLESEIQNSKWSTRGWTYQEGLFSRRCIFFSQHQVYFHCNGMLCTEDSPKITYLPEPKKGKWPPLQLEGYRLPDVRYAQLNSLIRSRMDILFETQGAMAIYTQFLGQYVHREVSYDEDAINAFSAMLARLQRDYLRKGFIHGIPRDAFLDGLLWLSSGSVSRRKDVKFPSWSWAAWKAEPGNGGINYGAPMHPHPQGTISLCDLSISLGKDQLYTSPTTNARLSGLSGELQNLWIAYRTRDHKPFVAKTNPTLLAANALYIDGPIMTLPVTYDSAIQLIVFKPSTSLSSQVRFDFGLREPVPKGVAGKHDFLLLETRGNKSSWADEYVHFILMMLQWEEGNTVASRAGILDIRIKGGVEAFWKFAGVRRSSFWLI